MKITCERSYLAHALGVTGRAVSSRNTLPILGSVSLGAGSRFDRDYDKIELEGGWKWMRRQR